MNLLPSVEKRIIKGEYRKRLMVVGLVFISILISTFLISISVSYIASGYEIAILERETESISKTNNTKGVMEDISIIKDTNSKLDILSKGSAKSLGYDLSSVFSSIASSSGVRLNLFSYNQMETKKGQTKSVGHRVTLGGVADDRESLQDFVKTLKSDKRFSGVDLPVSNLIESRDIKFLITIMVNKK